MSSVISGGFSSSGLGKIEAQRRIFDSAAIGCILASALARDCACLAVRRARCCGRYSPAAWRAAHPAPPWPPPAARARSARWRSKTSHSRRVERHLAAFEMQDMVDDIVEQVALVADDDHHAG
jgi:hypothetical protein